MPSSKPKGFFQIKRAIVTEIGFLSVRGLGLGLGPGLRLGLGLE